MIPDPGRFPGEEHGNPLQYSCLENSMDQGAWQATVHGVEKESDMTLRPTHHTVRGWVNPQMWNRRLTTRLEHLQRLVYVGALEYQGRNKSCSLIFLKFYFFLFLSVLHCSGFSLVEASRDYPLVAAHGLLTAVTSLVAEHGL